MSKYSFKACDWVDTSVSPARVKYGIQAKLVGAQVRWMHCAKEGEPLLFDSPEERDAELKRLRKKNAT